MKPNGPSSFKEAEQKELWKRKMKEKSVVEFPESREDIRNIWTNKVKRSAKGNINRFKARLSANEYSHRYENDYDEIFTPLIYQFVNFNDDCWYGKISRKMCQNKNRFLNGEIKEDIYKVQSEG